MHVDPTGDSCGAGNISMDYELNNESILMTDINVNNLRMFCSNVEIKIHDAHTRMHFSLSDFLRCKCVTSEVSFFIKNNLESFPKI